MISRSVTHFLAIALFVSCAVATPLGENQIESNDEDLEQGRQPRLLNIPNQIRPYCLKVVGKVQSAPKVCDAVSGYVVDATYSACKESFREICRLAVGADYGCEGIIMKICPKRATLEKKIKQNVNKHCEKSLQKIVDQFGKLASQVDKDTICGSFIDGVRQTCHATITDYCADVREVFRYPCTNFLPGLICD